jgi:hypothetical protein
VPESDTTPPADESPVQPAEGEQGVPIDKVMAKLTALGGQKDQQVAILQVLLDDRDAVIEQLRAELVRATSGKASARS